MTVLKDGELVRNSPPLRWRASGRSSRRCSGRSLAGHLPAAKTVVAADAPVVLAVRGLSAGRRRPRTCRSTSAQAKSSASRVWSAADARRSRAARVRCRAAGRRHRHSSTASRLRLRSPRDAIARGIVLLPESRKAEGLMLRRSIIENITLPHLVRSAAAGCPRRRREASGRARMTAQARRPRKRCRCAVWRSCRAATSRRSLFAKWLFRPPRVLIADEPTRGVDIGAKNAVYELVDSFARAGMSVVLVSSEVEGSPRALASRARHARGAGRPRARRSRRPRG